MDFTEDLTPRILLKQILITEPPRTPVGSSEPQAAGSSEPRRKSRRSTRDAEPKTPQNILRRSLRNKIQENITRKSLPLKRRTASAGLRQQAPSSSMMFDDGETPRHLLRNILQTEPVKSPVVHDKGAPAELQPPSEDNTVTRSRSSFELSGLDLPDVTMGNIASAAKGLSRKRPRQSLNVTAFEKRLKGENAAEEEPENSIGDHSSLSLSSSSSLSLKTPFIDVHTEKRGLQRRVSRRRKITEEEFCAALSKQQMGDVRHEVLQGREVGCEDTNLAGITLGLSKLSEPDVTVDIVNCQTALYDQHDALTSNFSITATQDKPAVMATQLQRDIQEEEEHRDEERQKSAEEEEEVVTNMEEDEGKENVDKTRDVSSKPEEKDDAVGFQTFDLDDGAEAAVDSQSEDVKGGSEEEEAAVGSQAEDEGVEQSPTEEEAAADSQSEEEAAVSPQAEDEGVEDSLPEDAAAASPSEEEEAAAGSQPEDEGGSVVRVNQLQRDDEEKSDGADRQTDQDYNDEERNQEEERHISRRAFRSEGGLILPVVKATEGLSLIKSKSYSALGLNTSLERIQNQTEKPDWAKPSLQHLDEDSWDVNDPADRKNASFHLLRVSHDAEVSRQQEDVEAAAEEAGEQEEESDEEEDDNEDFPGKTPAFVREKIKFFTSSPPASPSVFKNLPASSASEALPAVKPKQARRRRTGLSRRETVLPKTYLMSVFKHFAKTKVSADVFPVLNEIVDEFFDRVAEDLETYAAHAKRKTIEVEDVELLLRRQGFVNDKVPVEVLIEKYLRLDQRKILIPIATSGNVVIPKIRK
ncbi:centromere protein T isoform X3 [Xiphophorus couchianus]|uniref:centromere protein T isoform X3 n=1 Tax=Xiphophorus couchianus TaxID=32473 RepID=UPI001015F4BE|nr:centromere protein T isoform X3 [Xiphophorus couchianus]